MPSIHVGTSGWQHDTFDTVEVNNTFHQSPDDETLTIGF